MSFDFPYHGERKNRYNKYTVKNCLKTIDNVYKFVVKKYSNIKIDFMGKSLGSLYLYNEILKKWLKEHSEGSSKLIIPKCERNLYVNNKYMEVLKKL